MSAAPLTVARTADAVKSGEYDVAAAHQSLLYAITCHRPDVDPNVAAFVAHGPAGTSGGWQYVEREDLPDAWWEGSAATNGRDTPYPQPCHDHPATHVHTLSAC